MKPEALMTRTPTLAERVHPDRSALLVIDMQNDFVHPEGETARWMAQRLTTAGMSIPGGETLTERMVPTLQHLVSQARATAVPVIWVRMELDDQTRDPFMTAEGWHPCEPGTWGADWYAGLGPVDHEQVVVKRRHSAFFGTELADQLRADGIANVVVTGTATMGCVESTVRDAYANDFWAVVVSDCSGQMDEEAHRTAVERINRVFGMAADSSQVIEAWQAAPEDDGRASAG
jgi:ureidoacrylate peracid hydrolase